MTNIIVKFKDKITMEVVAEFGPFASYDEAMDADITATMKAEHFPACFISYEKAEV